MNSSFNENDYKDYIEGVQDGPLDTRTTQIVARHLTNWEQLAHYLQLTDAEIEEIKHDYPKYMEQKYECIRIWANKNGKAGTIINLLWHIYFDLNDKSLVMKIEEDLRNKDADKENLSAMAQPLPKQQRDDNKPCNTCIAS